MRYIICDDNKKFSETLKAKILALQPEAEIEIFTSASALLFYFEEISQKIDAVFMDVKLQSDNGIDIAAKLLPKFPAMKLVYVTGYSGDFVQDFFDCPSEARPVAVLSKPIETHYLKNALDKIAEAPVCLPVAIKQPSGMVYLSPDSIIAVCSSKRKLLILTDSETYELYGKMSEIMEALPPHFVQCHKSYIINMHRISEIKGWTTALMNDGTVYPISRSFKEQVKTTAALINS